MSDLTPSEFAQLDPYKRAIYLATVDRAEWRKFHSEHVVNQDCYKDMAFLSEFDVEHAVKLSYRVMGDADDAPDPMEDA